MLDFEYFCRVKRCLHIVNLMVGLAMLVACSQQTKVEVPEPGEGPTLALSQIDTLMWHQPDSALACLIPYFDTCCRDVACNVYPENHNGNSEDVARYVST